ncbi:MAG TPA: glycosyltransferase family 2 protein [Terriglobales bacterium]|nr:glycosyltransferase family 2 protein [Terriglobales bacterium]
MSAVDNNLQAQAANMAAAPVVSVIIPMRNEQLFIEGCLRSLLQQDCTLPYEIIVVDGRSTDHSREIVRRMEAEHDKIRLLHNPAGIVPTAMNLGISEARGEFIVRADAHSSYPSHYLQTCIELLNSTQADNVGGQAVTVPAGAGLGARLVAALLTSPFGVGNSYFRTATCEGYVDTVPFGAFRKELFNRIGLFDETLGRNEDNELNARILKAGGKVYLSSRLAFSYFPANSFLKLLAQTYRSARWHMFTVHRQNGSMRARHFVPAAFTAALLVLLALSFDSRVFLLILALLLAVYLLAATYFAVKASAGLSWQVAVMMPPAFLAFHLTYGCATFAGLPLLLAPAKPRPTR